MKLKILFLLLFISAIGFMQESISMNEVEQRQEISMSETTQSKQSGVWRYYKKGESTPFTGILYAQYPNGNWESRQEFVDGLGHGQWINYYENGVIKEIGYYNQDKVEGPIQKFYDNGKLQAEGTYKDWRIKICEWTYYDEMGELIGSVDYGEKGSIEEVNEYYHRGDISYGWYADILTTNGFQ